ncbi:DNA-binding transcriptional regulator, AcrR family [Rhodococcus jostii]|uniref:DNA-binding transcriptional regulator, AcrR family n=1 Tax=Rhodococcus jostii TaxID=132919 RepID=A0A1H4IV27_RHOJO|nr:DNA-binding transcriptional regulator, AcrR family [Rhodococcus jostii]
MAQNNVHGDGAGRPSTRRRRAKIQAIVEAAEHLFTSNGYADTSLGDIADRLNLSPKAIYYYFPSKLDILDAVIAEAFGYFDEDRLTATREQWYGQPLPEALVASSIDAVEHLVGRGDSLMVSFSESFRGNPRTSARHGTYMASWVDHVYRIIVDADGADTVTESSGRLLAEQIVDALFGVSVDSILRRRPQVVDVDVDGAVHANRTYFERYIANLLEGAVRAADQ